MTIEPEWCSVSISSVWPMGPELSADLGRIPNVADPVVGGTFGAVRTSSSVRFLQPSVTDPVPGRNIASYSLSLRKFSIPAAACLGLNGRCGQSLGSRVGSEPGERDRYGLLGAPCRRAHRCW